MATGEETPAGIGIPGHRPDGPEGRLTGEPFQLRHRVRAFHVDPTDDAGDEVRGPGDGEDELGLGRRRRRLHDDNPIDAGGLDQGAGIAGAEIAMQRGRSNLV